MRKDLKRQEKCSDELERENKNLKWKRDQLEADVKEENRKILNQLQDILVEQNTEVKNASYHANLFILFSLFVSQNRYNIT